MNAGEILKIKNVKLTAAVIAVVFLAVVIIAIYLIIFGTPQEQAELQQFTVGNNLISSSDVAKKLVAEDFIKSSLGFKIAFMINGGHNIQSGSYQISKAMNVWKIVKILSKEPSMKWITIPEGLRKEQIANILGEKLGWSDEQINKWVITYTTMKFDYVEGVYFSDTYLIPIDETPLQVAERLQRHFEEKFAPYSQEAMAQNIQWTTVIKLASIIQREAAGDDDMPIIAGILWNRLIEDMKLEVDATVQYTRDSLIHYGKAPSLYQDASYKTEGSWWTPIEIEDKQIDSPFNTYLYEGFPPRPIANPGLDAIKAVLHPEETECLYYLHDELKTIHCAKTLDEHEANIEKYLFKEA